MWSTSSNANSGLSYPRPSGVSIPNSARVGQISCNMYG